MKPVRSHPQDLGNFLESRWPCGLLSKPSVEAQSPVRRFYLVYWNSDRSGLVSQGAGDTLTDPPGSIGAELKSLAVLIPFGRFHQPDVSFLHEIQQRQSPTGITFCNINNKAEVAADQLVFAFLKDRARRPQGSQARLQFLRESL